MCPAVGRPNRNRSAPRASFQRFVPGTKAAGISSSRSITTIAVALAAYLALAPAHPVEFWRAIVKNKYTPPEGSDVPALASELADLLASPDPELRDEIAYSTLATWIYQSRILQRDAIRGLTGRLLDNLTHGIGEHDSDSVFRRSFSALILSVVVARDNATAFLSAQDVKGIEDAALAYSGAEQDLRGFDPVKGWMHSAAHTADLLKFLARSRYLEPADQRRILDAIAAKLTSAPLVFTHGEDERFARAVLSLINRPDFDREAFRSWTARSRPARFTEPLPTVAELRAAQNIKNLLSKLEVLLALDPQPSESVQSARDSVRAALKDLF